MDNEEKIIIKVCKLLVTTIPKSMEVQGYSYIENTGDKGENHT